MLSRRSLLLTSLAPLPLLAKRRLANVEETMGPLPPPSRLPATFDTLATESTPDYTRTRIRYAAPPGAPVFAWLLTPRAPSRRGALCLHQTTRIGKDEPAGLGGKPNLHYAHELAQRGWICLVPDYPGFGEDPTRDFPREVFSAGYVSGTMKGIVNHRRGVDLLLARGAKKIVTIGHSLGGHNAIFVAAFDPRIHAAVSSCGFTAMASYMKGNLKGWSQDRYMPRIATVSHNSPAELPWDFPDLFAAIAPRRLFLNSPLHDDNFDNPGVRAALARVQSRFPAGRLEAVYPDCGHDFPPEIRQQAYAFLDRA